MIKLLNFLPKNILYLKLLLFLQMMTLVELFLKKKIKFIDIQKNYLKLLIKKNFLN